MDRRGIARAFAAIGRLLGWGILGVICGIGLGLINGMIHSPPEVPGDDLANEWYTVGVMLIMFVEAVAGFLLGAGIGIGVHTPARRGRVFRLALTGAVLGLGIGWVLARVFHVILIDWHDGSELVSNMAVQLAGAIAGMAAARSAPTVGFWKRRVPV